MHYKKILAAALTIGCIGGILPSSLAEAASLKIRYSGKTRYYKGKQLKFSYTTRGLSSKYSGIQMKTGKTTVNMIPYYDYLVKQGPKVKRSYSKKTGKLVLKNGSKTLTAYVGKRTYYLNGKKKTFSIAPTKVKYYKTNKTVILLPAKVAITDLGLRYTYSSSAKRIYINKTVSNPSSSKPTAPSNGSTVYTNYNRSLSSYISAQEKKLLKYGGKEIDYKNYIDPAADKTNNYQFLRLDTYRAVNASSYNSVLNSKLKSGSVLKNKGTALTSAARTYNIDPVYFLCQTILETGYGTSELSQGKYITKVVSGKSVVGQSKSGKTIYGEEKIKEEGGVVTGFREVNGKFITKTIKKTKLYNLYGIKAYDDNPQLCGFSYAYYQGWTSVDKAISGAAKYVSQEYIHSAAHKQNTLYKFRYHPNVANLWHQYATDPAYAHKIASIMYSQFRSVYASGVSMTYDKPKFN